LSQSYQPREAVAIAHWDLSTDVAVVGLGCAGACAAVEAREANADVLVIERASAGGGTSAQSGGLIYMGGGTPVQQACGFDDTPDDMFAFLMAMMGPEPDEEKLRVYSDESVAHFHWLEEHGVPFKRSFYPEPSMEAPTDDCLVYSGGEDTWPFNEIARPAPRGHKPRAENAGGALMMQCLEAAVRKSGAEVMCDLGAVALVVEPDGGVVGVVCERDGREIAVQARRGVVLTAGGFVLNEEMVAQHSPLLARCSWKTSAGGDDGSGILMGSEVGGATIRMDAGECAIPLTPPRRLVRGVLVNRFGMRFINEDAYYGRIGQEALFRQDGELYWIHDEETYEVNLSGMQVEAVGETFEELEREIGLPEGALVSTMALYNRHARAGRDPVFHKAAEFLKPLENPPFGVIRVATDNAIYAGFTLGGLRTAVDGEVLTNAGNPIAGLFAAGRTSSGVAAWGYASGTSLGDGTYFGRRAGRRAAG